MNKAEAEPDIPQRETAEQARKGEQEQSLGASPNQPHSLADARHALRTPLNHIIGYSEMLLEEAGERDLRDSLPDLQKIHTAGKQLLTLINDLLDPTKTQSDSSPLSSKSAATSVSFRDIDAGTRTLAEDSGAAPQTSSGRLLVVDDNARNRDLLSRRLKQQGYSVCTADNGRQALELIQTQPVDLILLDVKMPGMSGYEVCKTLRARSETSLLPVIMVTASGPAERVKGIESGADDFLTKPVNQVEVLARVRSLLRIKALHDAVEAHAQHLALWNKELEVKLARETKLAEISRSLGDISHDMKNLTMPIITGTGLLREEIADLLHMLPDQAKHKANASQKTCAEIMDMSTANAERIEERAREIADCIKGLSSPLHVQDCELAEVISNVVKTLRPIANQKNLSLNTEGLEKLPIVQVDPRRMFNAFYNLINNAIPEVQSGGSITVRGDVSAEGDVLILSVKDTGRGMSPAVRESLFTDRVISQKKGGTGLGIKIAKDSIDAHGGSISVASTEGEGTTFWIRLSLRPPGATYA